MATASGLAQLWAAVSQSHPEGVPAEVVRALTGLHYEVATNAALLQAVETRQGGKATITLRVRTEPWSPEIAMQTEKSSQVIKPGEVVNVQTEVALPDDLAGEEHLPAKGAARVLPGEDDAHRCTSRKKRTDGHPGGPKTRPLRARCRVLAS